MTCKVLATTANADATELFITFEIPSQNEPFVIKTTAAELIQGYYAWRILNEMNSTLLTNLADIKNMVEE